MRESSETRDRFLLAIAEKVPPAAVVEVHLFQPIRQSGFESGVAVVAVRENQPDRLAVYTARYRLILKGPDRGKWELTVRAEADAPLVTVDKVVRGVQTRAGDVEGAERLTGDEFRALLPAANDAVAGGAEGGGAV
jgi:hypothetical protein